MKPYHLKCASIKVKMAADWKRLRNTAQDIGFIVSDGTIKMRVCGENYVLVEYSRLDDKICIIDRFKYAETIKCTYMAAVDYLYQILLLPNATIPRVPIPDHHRIKKMNNHVRIDYGGGVYYICDGFILDGNGTRFRFVARGELFDRGRFRYTDDDFARFIQMVVGV
jgi:hypothetical protein